jgi:hypothetical protein
MLTVKQLKDFLKNIPEHVEINLDLNLKKSKVERDAYDRPTTLILILNEDKREVEALEAQDTDKDISSLRKNYYHRNIYDK